MHITFISVKPSPRRYGLQIEFSCVTRFHIHHTVPTTFNRIVAGWQLSRCDNSPAQQRALHVRRFDRESVLRVPCAAERGATCHSATSSTSWATTLGVLRACAVETLLRKCCFY